MFELQEVSYRGPVRAAPPAAFAAIRVIRRHEDLFALGEELLPATGVLLGEHLLAAGVVTAEGLREALALQPRLADRRLGWILTTLGRLRQDDLDRVLAARKGVVTVSLSGFRPSIDYTQRLPFEVARRFGMVLLHEEEGVSWVAAADAQNPHLREVATFALGRRVVLLRAGRREFDTYLRERDPRTVALRSPYYDAIQGVRGQQNHKLSGPLEYVHCPVA